MKDFLNRLTSMWTLTAGLLGMMAWTITTLASRAQSTGLWLLAAVFLGVAGGLLMRWQWARRAALVLLLGMVAFWLHRLVNQPFHWWQVIGIVVFAAAACHLWWQPDNGVMDGLSGPRGKPAADNADGDGGEDSRPMVSLVHLRRHQRYLEAPVLAHALSEAWNLNIVAGGGGSDSHDHDNDPADSGGTGDADGVVVGENPILMVMLHKPTFAMFTVHNHDTNYFDDPEKVAEQVPNLRFARIIRDHGGWLAIDLVSGENTRLDPDEAYRLIGKAVSALADDDTLALLCPQLHCFNLWSAELEATLCGDSPLEALREEVKAPVIGVPDGETIEKAIAEARQRWPEFVASFKNRRPNDERFLVKAPFEGENGEREHMWLQVFALEPAYVHGHLINEPIHNNKLKMGAQVEVPVADISDWLCPDAEDQVLGNFTQQAVSQAASQKCPPGE